jgi:hypothetical protein
MGFAGYVAVCVQLYCRCFTVFHLVVTVYTTCFGLHGHLQVCRESASLVLLARDYTLRVSFVFFCSVLLVIFLEYKCVLFSKTTSETRKISVLCRVFVLPKSVQSAIYVSRRTVKQHRSIFKDTWWPVLQSLFAARKLIGIQWKLTFAVALCSLRIVLRN